MKKINLILSIFLIFIIGCSNNNTMKDEPVDNGLNLQQYVACGCGCCGGIEPIEQCLYHANNDDMNKIIDEDKKLKDNPQCATMGCSSGIKYSYCD